MDEYLEWVNENEDNLGWSADPCKFTKSHPQHEDCHQVLVDLEVEEKQQVQHKTPQLHLHQEGLGLSLETDERIFEAAHKEIQKFQKYQFAAQIPDKEIPESFDLRNIDGVNYAGKVRDQGDCGSCYANAFIQVIESRLRMKYGIFVVPDLSVQQIVSCNYMTEGCSGGWGNMNGFFAENVPLVTEGCAPYAGKEGKCKPY